MIKLLLCAVFVPCRAVSEQYTRKENGIKSNLSASNERERDKCRANDDSIGQKDANITNKQTTKTKGLEEREGGHVV